MLGLPKTTELSKSIFKKNLYLKFNMNEAAKRSFDEDIAKVTIVNEVSPVSTNIAAGEEVSRFFVVHVVLKRENFSDKNIELLSKMIAQKMLFVLEYEGRAVLALTEGKLLKTQWTDIDGLTVPFEGLNLDIVWSKIVSVVLGGEWDDTLNIEENIEQHAELVQISKEILKLEKQIKNEKQPKKKFELVQKMKKLKEKSNDV